MGRDGHCFSLVGMDISQGTWMLFKAPVAAEEWEILAGLCPAPSSCTPGTCQAATLQTWMSPETSTELRDCSSSVCVWVLFCRSVTNQTGVPKALQWGDLLFWNLSVVCWINTWFVSLFSWLPQPGIYYRYNQIIKKASVCPQGIFPYTVIRNTLSVLSMPFILIFSKCFLICL